MHEKALEVELNRLGIAVQRQVPVPVDYQGEQDALFYRNLFVADQIVVEVKALGHQLSNDERAQVINYVKATVAPVGLSFNFRRRKLEYKRIFPDKPAEAPAGRTGRDNVLKN